MIMLSIFCDQVTHQKLWAAKISNRYSYGAISIDFGRLSQMTIYSMSLDKKDPYKLPAPLVIIIGYHKNYIITRFGRSKRQESYARYEIWVYLTKRHQPI